ncbi:ATP-dependent RNA helicase DDX19A-like [Babylonia areolata]|uniref:ATP-dependent RNA helicase DDX19A-like n=1 Tax=Babylonia areolata TaxID=304850 RepID=UPI003FD40509
MADDWGALAIQQEQKLAEKVSDLNIQQSQTNTTTPAASTAPPPATTAPAPALAPVPAPRAVTAAGDNAGAQASSQAPGGATGTTSTAPAASASTTDEEGSGDKETTKEDVSLLQKLLHSKLINAKADIEVLRKDPNSPLYSVKSFEALNLKAPLLKGVYGMGFNAPSKIQETALPILLADPPVNMIAQSQSGTGKTAAFVLTMLSRVDVSQNYPQCLCLAPTYELALQIGEVIQKMSQYMTGIKIRYATRGERVARGECLEDHIIIGTPGTVMDWSHRFKALALEGLKVFVLDEADVMISMQGHQDQSTRIQKRLSSGCQMLLFSATYDQSVMQFAQRIIPNDPVVIRLKREEESLDNIKQFYIDCSDIMEKYTALCNIYGTISVGQSMIFCHKRTTASWLAEKMTADHHAVGLLTGELTIEQRAAIIRRFREGKEKVLITTNVSARGIDVEMVTVVVNFDMPITMEGRPDCETYLHRIGRTGRFGKNGIAINMVDNSRSLSVMRAIEKHFGRKIEKLDTDDLDEIEKIST